MAKSKDISGSCRQCCFWKNVPETEYGQCRRYPPTLIQSSPGSHLLQGGTLGVFPETESKIYCGEFKLSTSPV